MAIRPMWFQTVFWCVENISIELCCGKLYLIATTTLCFVWINMENKCNANLSSLPTVCQVKDFGEEEKLFHLVKKKKKFGGKILNGTLFCFRSDQPLCSFVNFIKRVVVKGAAPNFCLFTLPCCDWCLLSDTWLESCLGQGVISCYSLNAARTQNFKEILK